VSSVLHQTTSCKIFPNIPPYPHRFPCSPEEEIYTEYRPSKGNSKSATCHMASTGTHTHIKLQLSRKSKSNREKNPVLIGEEMERDTNEVIVILMLILM